MSIAELLSAGVVAAQQKDRERARKLFTTVLHHDRSCAEAWFWLSAVVEDSQQAIDCLERVVRLQPGHPQARERLEVLRVVQLLQAETPVLEAQPVRSAQRLGEWLLEKQLITPAQLDQALAAQQRMPLNKREPLGAILLRQKSMSPERLKQAIEAQIIQRLGNRDAEPISQLGHYLVNLGYVSAGQLAHCIVAQTLAAIKGRKVRLGEVMVRERVISPKMLNAALQAQESDYHNLFHSQ